MRLSLAECGKLPPKALIPLFAVFLLICLLTLSPRNGQKFGPPPLRTVVPNRLSNGTRRKLDSR